MTVMQTLLFTLIVGSRREVLLARQRARQIAALLGYDPLQRAALAALVFEKVHHRWQEHGRLSVRFALADGEFQVYAGRQPTGRPRAQHHAQGRALLACPLPAGGPRLTGEDLPWAARELARLTPLHTFEEVFEQNRELLALCNVQAFLASIPGSAQQPSAA
jgi:hypothetical protein